MTLTSPNENIAHFEACSCSWSELFLHYESRDWDCQYISVDLLRRLWIINLVNLGHQPRLTRLSGESREGVREQRLLRDHFLGAKVEKRDFASCLNYIFCAFQEKGFSTTTLEETFCYVVMSGERRKRERVEAIFWRIEKKDFTSWLMSYLKRTFSTFTL